MCPLSEQTGSGWDQWIDGLHEALVDAKSRLRKDPLSEGDLEALMRDFHLIKGFAHALGMRGVQALASELEALVSRTDAHRTAELKTGFSKLEMTLNRLHELTLLEAARNEIRHTGTLKEFLERLTETARGIAAEILQKVQITVLVDDSVRFDRKWKIPLEGAVLHALRNSLDHGGAGLKRELRIQLRATETEGCITLVCEDDGAGVDVARVREALRQSKGLATQLDTMNDEAVLQLLFLPGLSLGRGRTPLSGRGYGLDIVREAVEKRLGGRARLEIRQGGGTRLVMEFKR